MLLIVCVLDAMLLLRCSTAEAETQWLLQAEIMSRGVVQVAAV